MKLTPFEVLLRTLTGGRGGLNMTKDDAIARLKRMTGQDFGMDIDAWRRWGRSHPNISGIAAAEQEGTNSQ